MPYRVLRPAITQGTLCRKKEWSLVLTLMCADRLPVGLASPLLVDIKWQPPRTDGVVTLRLRKKTPSATGDATFDEAGAEHDKAFTGNVRQIIEIRGRTLSTPNTKDIVLDVIVDEESQGTVELSVGAVTSTIEVRLADGSATAPTLIATDAATIVKAVVAPAPTGGRVHWEALEGTTAIEITKSGTIEECAHITVHGTPTTERTLLALYGPPETSTDPAIMTVYRFNTIDLEQTFGEFRLTMLHLSSATYLARLEAMTPAQVQQYIDRATDDVIRNYLTRLKVFASEQAALAAAPVGNRQSITFVMGPTTDAFYDAATRYFTMNPETHFDGTLRNLVAVRDHLANNRPSNGLPWGEVNIVVHANEEGGMSIPVIAGGEEAAPDSIQDAVTNHHFLPLDDAIVDCRSLIRIRGCALGQSADMLEKLSKAFGGGGLQRPDVHAPKHLQTYEWRTRSGTLFQTEEYLTKFWFVGWPHGARPNKAALAAQFTAKYPAEAVDWARAIAGTLAGHTQATRNRTYAFTFTYTYPTGSGPLPFANDVARLAFLRANANFDATLALSGRTADQYTWNYAERDEPNGPGMRQLTLIATGRRTILRIETEVRTELQLQFGATAARQAELTARTFTAAMRQEFTNHHVETDVNAEVTILETGTRWVITDAKNIHSYLVNLAGATLNVNLEREIEPPHPAPRAHPASTHATHFGQHVSVHERAHPLGQNVPVRP